MSTPHPIFSANLPPKDAQEKEALRAALCTPERDAQVLAPLLKDLDAVIQKHRAATQVLPIPLTPGEVTLALLHLGAMNTMQNREGKLPLPVLVENILQLFADLLMKAHQITTRRRAETEPAG